MTEAQDDGKGGSSNRPTELPYSTGTKIHSNRYINSPTPPQIISTTKSNRHNQDSIPVDRAIPPHTPPNQRSFRLRRNPLTADARGS